MAPTEWRRQIISLELAVAPAWLAKAGISIAPGASDVLRRNPIIGIVGCCASAASGQAAAALPRSVMKSRRRMSDPKLRRRYRIGLTEYFDRG
jgi:hypothetical protein